MLSRLVSPLALYNACVIRYAVSGQSRGVPRGCVTWDTSLGGGATTTAPWSRQVPGKRPVSDHKSRVVWAVAIAATAAATGAAAAAAGAAGAAGAPTEGGSVSTAPHPTNTTDLPATGQQQHFRHRWRAAVDCRRGDVGGSRRRLPPPQRHWRPRAAIEHQPCGRVRGRREAHSTLPTSLTPPSPPKAQLPVAHRFNTGPATPLGPPTA